MKLMLAQVFLLVAVTQWMGAPTQAFAGGGKKEGEKAACCDKGSTCAEGKECKCSKCSCGKDGKACSKEGGCACAKDGKGCEHKHEKKK